MSAEASLFTHPQMNKRPPSHCEINIKAAKIETLNNKTASTKPSPNTANSPRKLDILLHNSNALRVQRAEIRILE